MWPFARRRGRHAAGAPRPPSAAAPAAVAAAAEPWAAAPYIPAPYVPASYEVAPPRPLTGSDEVAATISALLFSGEAWVDGAPAGPVSTGVEPAVVGPGAGGAHLVDLEPAPVAPLPGDPVPVDPVPGDPVLVDPVRRLLVATTPVSSEPLSELPGSLALTGHATAAPEVATSSVPRAASSEPDPEVQRPRLEAAAPLLSAALVPVQATHTPQQGPVGRVSLGFRDGSTTELAPDSDQAAALEALALLLSLRD